MILFNIPKSLADRLAAEAKMLREEVKLLPLGSVRDATIRAARLADIAAHSDEWANSQGLQPPKRGLTRLHGIKKRQNFLPAGLSLPAR